MASTLFHSSIHPSSSVFTRTRFCIPLSRDNLLEFSQHRCYNNSRSTAKGCCRSRKFSQVKSATTESPVADVGQEARDQEEEEKKLRILVAGGGIGGLVFALAAKRKGFDVVVLEKDTSAIRGEGQYRGPIQIQSNALAALEAIDMDVAEQVMGAGCITGDRINGLVDGVSGTWYVKFDTFTPAAERGLPVTRVISRMTLQKILAEAVGDDIILNGSNVVDFEDDGTKVAAVLDNGMRFEGDILIGADGIWSKVRKRLFGPKEATYSDYTCYTGIADFVPPDIETVGYRVFLGHKQYFVSSDVGAGKMQWYAFHKEPPGGSDEPNAKKERLLKIFEGWCDNVIDLIVSTDEESILRRDIYDRTPVFTWGKGRVTLLGDSVHAMQPNMGQGGCMAIEDAYQLALELDNAWKNGVKSGTPMDVISSLKSYEKARRLRVTIIHGMARMAAIMASTYKAYLGVGLGPLEFLTKYRIPHPGRVGGRFFVNIAMPMMLSWVLGGNSSKLEGRPQCCRLSDKASDRLRQWFEDDDALERAMSGQWVLLPSRNESGLQQPISLGKEESKEYIIGSATNNDLPGVAINVPSPQVSKMHARINYKDGAFFLTDLCSEHGTWIINQAGVLYQLTPNLPTRIRPSDVIQFGSDESAVFRVKVVGSPIKFPDSERSGILQAA